MMCSALDTGFVYSDIHHTSRATTKNYIATHDVFFVALLFDSYRPAQKK